MAVDPAALERFYMMRRDETFESWKLMTHDLNGRDRPAIDSGADDDQDCHVYGSLSG
jgi:hypothetical protein